jgi:diacylglycerol kinase (CTP)
MNIPANDPLSLALAHDNTPRRRSTRSPSPFSQSANGGTRVTRRVIRRISGLQSPPGSAPIEIIEVDEDEAEMVAKQLQNIADTGSTNGGSAKAHIQKIDWEVPRKLLHSSIGFFTMYLYVSQGSPARVIMVLWAALALVIVPADVLRLNYPPFERLYERFLGFLMRDSEKKSTNGVIWYILGVNFALTFYPLDVATVAILILSWADTAASTFGRLWGRYTRPLPSRMPIIPLPFAPRKSLAGFIAASVTGACIAASFWTYVAPIRQAGLSWTFQDGVSSDLRMADAAIEGQWNGGGWLGLTAITLTAGIVSGIAEALDLSLDDNLTLPIISGGCLLGFFKLLGLFSSS